MNIRFLKDCTAPQSYIKYCAEGCCSWFEWEDAFFVKGEEIDSEDSFNEVDISNLQVGVDFELI